MKNIILGWQLLIQNPPEFFFWMRRKTFFKEKITQLDYKYDEGNLKNSLVGESQGSFWMTTDNMER